MKPSHPHSASRPTRALGLTVVLLSLVVPAVHPPEAHAQGDLRTTFPGRRVGGGTRGECSSRPLAHLVPVSSVFAPGQSRTRGVLEGPSPSPSPLDITFRPYSGRGNADDSTTAGVRRLMPASSPGITLLTLPAVKVPTLWESRYVCPGATPPAPPADPLIFVSAVSPPALSLLVEGPSPEDKALQAALAGLRRACGSSIPRDQVAATFGLGDLITARWPERIPVRCPG